MRHIQGVSTIFTKILMATEFQMFVLVQVTVNAPFIQALVIQITWTHGCTHVTVNAA